MGSLHSLFLWVRINFVKDAFSSSSTRKLTAQHVTVPLHEKPRLFQMGAGVHGISTRIDHFRLPGLWCVHFYRYRARLRLNDIWLDILPGSVGITPPDCDIEYRYEGRSEHLYAHFSLAPSTRNTSGHTFSDEVTIPLIQAADDEMLQSQWQETVGYAATRKAAPKCGYGKFCGDFPNATSAPIRQNCILLLNVRRNHRVEVERTDLRC
jgi:hypothetical protein